MRDLPPLVRLRAMLIQMAIMCLLLSTLPSKVDRLLLNFSLMFLCLDATVMRYFGRY